VTYAIRPVRPEDVPAVVAMVHELAAFERSPDECRLTGDQLHAALFAPDAAVFGHVAYDEAGQPAGMTLWFRNFSTWEGVHGVHLEDLYVRPHARGTGLGRQLLATLAAHCVERGYPRLDWSVLDWNPAREFYHRLGAGHQSQWLPYRLTGDALSQLAATAGTDNLTVSSLGRSEPPMDTRTGRSGPAVPHHEAPTP
jgi:GNAT superfamily N-acetyltransferase